MEPNFQLKTYGLQELSILYAPGLTPSSASKRLVKWIVINPELYERLKRSGWIKGYRLLTPIQVGIIIEYLGEP